MTAPLQTEFAFTLPCGYPDAFGNLHRHGVMRRATALDEILPLQDPRVVANPAYVSILVLSRVVTRLGDAGHLTPEMAEQLFSTDFAYLQDLYLQINETGSTLIETACPSCQTRFVLDLGGASDE
jgi:hypothetical protein